jgi:hypothetical protein
MTSVWEVVEIRVEWSDSDGDRTITEQIVGRTSGTPGIDRARGRREGA